MAKEKFEVVIPWAGVTAGQVFEAEASDLSPALLPNIRKVGAKVKVDTPDTSAIIEEAKAEAGKIVEAAKAEAGKIVEAAKAEAGKIVEAAKAEAEGIKAQAETAAVAAINTANEEAERIKAAASQSGNRK